MIHAAEGVDQESAAEIDLLDEMRLLDRRTVLVHGIAVTDRQTARLAETASSLIWCPTSNLRLYERTAPIDRLKKKVRIGLGTDSTLSGSPHLLAELRAAVETGLATPAEVLSMVTTEAASIFGLRDRGHLDEGAAGDLVIVEDPGGTVPEVLLALRPSRLAAVFINGRPRLTTPEIARRLGLGTPNLRIDGALKWLYKPIDAAHARLQRCIGASILDDNPWWKLLQPL